MLLVSADNLSDEFVPDDIGVFKANKAYALDGGEGLDGLDQARFPAVGEIDLGGIARDDTFRFGAKAGEKHKHLFGGGILAFIENNKGTVEGTTAHVGERRNF